MCSEINNKPVKLFSLYKRNRMTQLAYVKWSYNFKILLLLLQNYKQRRYKIC